MAVLIQSEIVKVFHEIASSIKSAPSPSILKHAVDSIGASFGLDRCLILLHHGAAAELAVAAEYTGEGSLPLGSKRYRLERGSQWYGMLAQGRPLPLKELSVAGDLAGPTPEFNRFVEESQSKAIVAFPMVANGKLLGCLSMHYCREARAFSEEMLEAGEALVAELALAILQFHLIDDEGLPDRVFADCGLPLVVVAPQSFRIVAANEACSQLIGTMVATGSCLLDLFPGSDRERLTRAAHALSQGAALRFLEGLTACTAGGEPLIVDVCLGCLGGLSDAFVVAALLPKPAEIEKTALRTTEPERVAKLEELVGTLSRQLNWERISRHLIATVHLSLDRDTVLQTAVDSLGRALAASRCLFVKGEGPGSPVVTHEYVQPDISPLGLGRTGQFPVSVVSWFKQRSAAVSDLLALPAPLGLSPQDLNALSESGIRAVVGTPVSRYGVTHGVLIVTQSERPRQWPAQEIELIETVAGQLAVSLNHTHSYAQIKDQLFKTNLISNLTQQLTSALDSAARTTRTLPGEETRQPGASPPLSSRELEVLKLIASGLANREIAQRLFLTESTVELHASRIRKKLKLKSRTALVKYACDHHLV